MQKAKFIELLRHELVGGIPTADDLSKYPDRTLAAYAGHMYDLILLEIYQSVKHSRAFHVFDTLVKTYKVKVLYDNDREEYYSVMPDAGFSSIPNDVAIRKVRPLKDPEREFGVIDMVSQINFSHDMGNQIIDTTSYYHDSAGRIYYYQMEQEYGESKPSVYMSIVVPFSAFSDEDFIPEPNSMRGSLFDMTISLIRTPRIKPSDMTPDNVSDTLQQKIK